MSNPSPLVNENSRLNPAHPFNIQRNASKISENLYPSAASIAANLGLPISRKSSRNPDIQIGSVEGSQPQNNFPESVSKRFY